MSFIRTRTIKGRQYRYLEERWREGKRVRSRSTYLGTIGAFIGANLRSEGKAWEVTEADLAEKKESPIAGAPVTPSSSETAPRSPDETSGEASPR